MNKSEPLKAIIVGAGHRSLAYASYAQHCPDELQIVAVADPRELRRQQVADLYGLPAARCFETAEQVAGEPKFADVVINGTMEVVDHQSVLIEFEDGATATHNMIGGASRPSRSIHLIGTEGEIQGVFEDRRFVIRHIDPRPGHEYSEEAIDLDDAYKENERPDSIGPDAIGRDMHGAFGGHGGGDLRLVADFVRVVRGEPASISTTDIRDSVAGHLIGFCADRAMQEHRVVDLDVAY